MTFSKHDAIANEFCKQYAIIKEWKSTKESRTIFRNIKINNQLDTQYLPFTIAMTVDAIRKTKNYTAAGPNGLTALHLKHLGPNGIRFLTRLYNLSVQ